MKRIDEIQRILQEHKSELHDAFGVKEIGIFGSYSRGEQTEKSDLDILVSFDKTVSFLRLVSLENYLTDLLGIVVDVIPREDLRIELKAGILQEAFFV